MIKLITYRTLNDLLKQFLKGDDFQIIGATNYIVHLQGKNIKGEKISKREVSLFYKTKSIILEPDKESIDKLQKRVEEKQINAQLMLYHNIKNQDIVLNNDIVPEQTDINEKEDFNVPF
jgi:hypothetical protein